ncbi:MAG: hypothetical protein WCO96_03310 [Actinomycetes bacterium]
MSRVRRDLLFSVAALAACLVLAPAASAALGTHGCWKTIDGYLVQVIATTNISCPNAAAFAVRVSANTVDLSKCSEVTATTTRCISRYRGYLCANRLTFGSLRGKRVSVRVSLHCMKGPNKRIGYSWAGVIDNPFREWQRRR